MEPKNNHNNYISISQIVKLLLQEDIENYPCSNIEIILTLSASWPGRPQEANILTTPLNDPALWEGIPY